MVRAYIVGLIIVLAAIPLFARSARHLGIVEEAEWLWYQRAGPVVHITQEYDGAVLSSCWPLAGGYLVDCPVWFPIVPIPPNYSAYNTPR